MYPARFVSNTLRILGQGVRVCAGVSIMALYAGLLPHGEKVVVIDGSGSGADTSVVLTPAHAKKSQDQDTRSVVQACTTMTVDTDDTVDMHRTRLLP